VTLPHLRRRAAYERGRPESGETLMSDRLAQLIEDGRKVSAVEYHAARALQRAIAGQVDVVGYARAVVDAHGVSVGCVTRDPG